MTRLVSRPRPTADKIALALAGVLLCVLPARWSRAGEAVQLIAGAGPSTRVVQRFAALLGGLPEAEGYVFEVPERSIKHAGGLRSTRKYLFGRTGRPLTADERARGYEEIFLAKMPIAFVAGEGAGVSRLTLEQVCGLFTGRYTNWKQVGGNDAPVVVLSREPTEALFSVLKRDVPCMNRVVDTPYVFKKDHLVVEMLLRRPQGRTAIGFGAARNFPPERILEVEGFSSGVNVGLVYRAENGDHPLVRAARELARSARWRDEVARMGLGWPY